MLDPRCMVLYLYTTSNLVSVEMRQKRLSVRINLINKEYFNMWIHCFGLGKNVLVPSIVPVPCFA